MISRFYLTWSMLYLPVFIYWLRPYFGEILLQIRLLNLPLWCVCLLFHYFTDCTFSHVNL